MENTCLSDLIMSNMTEYAINSFYFEQYTSDWYYLYFLSLMIFFGILGLVLIVCSAIGLLFALASFENPNFKIFHYLFATIIALFFIFCSTLGTGFMMSSSICYECFFSKITNNFPDYVSYNCKKSESIYDLPILTSNVAFSILRKNSSMLESIPENLITCNIVHYSCLENDVNKTFCVNNLKNCKNFIFPYLQKNPSQIEQFIPNISYIDLLLYNSYFCNFVNLTRELCNEYMKKSNSENINCIKRCYLVN